MASDEFDYWSPERVGRLQSKRWAQQREYVNTNSTFYQRLWDGAAPPEKLTDLPALPLASKPMLRESQAAVPPYGDYLATPPERVQRVHRTAGTTGRGMHIALSRADAVQYAEIGARALRGCGLGPGHRIVHCLNYTLWTGGFTDQTTLEATGATAIPFGVGNTALLIQTVREIGITAIYCTPSYPAVLEQVIADKHPDVAPRDLGLKLAILTGEAGAENPSFRERVDAVWGFASHNLYGVSDVMTTIAGPCEAQEELHYQALDTLYPELIDPDTGASIPWQDGAAGELVVTHLARECQPMVRYRTGDVMEILTTEPCACGRTSPRVRIRGRADDMVVVRAVNVFPSAVAAVVAGMPELSGEFLIRLPGPGPYDRLPLEVELAEGQSASPELSEAITTAVRDAVRATPAVTLLPPRSLPRSSGKTRRVIRED